MRDSRCARVLRVALVRRKPRRQRRRSAGGTKKRAGCVYFSSGIGEEIPDRANAQLRAFVLISAATGVLHAALQRDGQWLGDADLPKEIARITRTYRMTA